MAISALDDFNGLRRYFSRTYWMLRLLGLRRRQKGATGLVLIQVDGLSYLEIQGALGKKEMPFLAGLLRHKGYSIRPMYTGLPSNTPAVQGELFYGIAGAVPAFSFFDRESGHTHKMLEPESALKFERLLADQGEPLLQGGSAYGNIYTGGADEPRWCAASMGWGTASHSPGLAVLALLALLNAYGFARTLAFAALEMALAIYDALKGVGRGQGIGPEFKYIGTRVGICILMREWITEAAKMDVARGLPIVHLNFIGYDEQSHRRGPDAAFAHWVLKGIDDAIKRIWSAARKSDRRDYEVWIYSDHGQVHSTPYSEATGSTLKEAIQAMDASVSVPKILNRRSRAGPRMGDGSRRIRYLGGQRLQKWFPVPDGKDGPKENQTYPIVTDLGPVALVYLEPGATDSRRRAFGAKLVQACGIPIVLDAKTGGGLHGWTSEGPFVLPRDLDSIFGGHPYSDQILPDLERLCRHPFGGDLILLGWKMGMPKPFTFALENGAHGGVSPEECTAFTILPRQVSEGLPPESFRPLDLHRAGMLFQGRNPT
jgi:Type I phosphodiesterase / nucleotide pyrophosphatase